MFWMQNLYIVKVSDTSSHMHVRVTMVIRCFFAAHFGGLNTANVGSSRDKSLHTQEWESMRDSGLLSIFLRKRATAVYEARFGHDAGQRVCRTNCLNTANEGSFRHTSFHAASGSVRRCCAVVHPGGSACLSMFRVHSRYTLLGNSTLHFTDIALQDRAGKPIKQVVNRHAME